MPAKSMINCVSASHLTWYSPPSAREPCFDARLAVPDDHRMPNSPSGISTSYITNLIYRLIRCSQNTVDLSMKGIQHRISFAKKLAEQICERLTASQGITHMKKSVLEDHPEYLAETRGRGKTTTRFFSIYDVIEASADRDFDDFNHEQRSKTTICGRANQFFDIFRNYVIALSPMPTESFFYELF